MDADVVLDGNVLAGVFGELFQHEHDDRARDVRRVWHGRPARRGPCLSGGARRGRALLGLWRGAVHHRQGRRALLARLRPPALPGDSRRGVSARLDVRVRWRRRRERGAREGEALDLDPLALAPRTLLRGRRDRSASDATSGASRSDSHSASLPVMPITSVSSSCRRCSIGSPRMRPFGLRRERRSATHAAAFLAREAGMPSSAMRRRSASRSASISLPTSASAARRRACPRCP